MLRVIVAAAAVALPAFSVRAGEAFVVVNGPEGTVKAPLFSAENGSLPVAQVDGQPVTLEEFSGALAAVHGAQVDPAKAGAKDFRPVLDRLIGVRLVTTEAHDMGLDELPELKKAVSDHAASQLRRTLLQRLAQDVKPDPDRVEFYFREAVREWKLRSILFAQQADAKQMSAAAKAGNGYDELVAQATVTKKGTAAEGDFVSAQQMLPQVAAAAQGLFKGQVSDPVQVSGGWAIFRVDDIRYPEDAKARAAAEERATDEARQKALDAIYAKMLQADATVDRKLLAKLDFESKKPGFAALEKDPRVLARIKGGKDITVADLTAAIRVGLYHGVDDAVRLKRVNAMKERTFENLLRSSILGVEAERQRIAETPEYKRAVAEYRDSLVFGEFVRRVVVPDLKITEEEGKTYYVTHKSEFTAPAYYRLDSLCFAKAAAAQSAFDKLRAGTDLAWLKTNADGQIEPEKRNFDLSGAVLSAESLPAALKVKLAGARPGDAQLFASGDQTLVVVVKAVTPATLRPYPEARSEIAKKLTSEKMNKAVEDWVARLRKAHHVTVYLTRLET